MKKLDKDEQIQELLLDNDALKKELFNLREHYEIMSENYNNMNQYLAKILKVSEEEAFDCFVKWTLKNDTEDSSD